VLISKLALLKTRDKTHMAQERIDKIRAFQTGVE
jgi:hypothetical protein